MTDIMNDIETDAAELRKTADEYDLVAGKWLANLTTAEYAERLEGLCKAGEAELSLHRKAITGLPPYVASALREGDVRTLKAFRDRRGAEHIHPEVEAWYHFGGGRESIKTRRI
jgi:hypothetical protein